MISQMWMTKFEEAFRDCRYPVLLVPSSKGGAGGGSGSGPGPSDVSSSRKSFANERMRALFGTACDAPNPSIMNFVDRSTPKGELKELREALQDDEDCMSALTLKTTLGITMNALLYLKILKKSPDLADLSYHLIIMTDMDSPDVENELRRLNAFVHAIPDDS
jgi:hypothetical protein